jgi:ankyrin repeat protein
MFIHLLTSNIPDKNKIIEICKSLFETYNPNLFIENDFAYTPFLFSLRQGFFELFQWFAMKLKKEKIYFEKEKFLPKIILDPLCNEEMKLQILQFLIKNYDVCPNIFFENKTLLHMAAEYGYLKIMDYLLQFLDVNIGDLNDNRPPLFNVISSSVISVEQKIFIANFLISKGANVNAQTEKENLTPLGLSIMSGEEKLIKFFIHNPKVNLNVNVNFNINEMNKIPTIMLLMFSPFHIDKKLELIQYCLKNRADIQIENIKIGAGETFLHIATHFGDFKIMKFLIENTKLSLSDQNENGDTSLDCIILSEDFSETLKLKILNYLQEHINFQETIYFKKSGGSLIHESFFLGEFKIAEYLLLQSKGTLNHQNRNGYTPIHILLFNSNLNEIQKINVLQNFMKKYEFNIFVLTYTNQTLLHLCGLNGFLKILDFFMIEKNLKSMIDQKDYYGNTPLMTAIYAPLSNRDILNVVHHLVEIHGADINLENIYKQSSIKLSFENKNFSVYFYLLSQIRKTISKLSKSPTPDRSNITNMMDSETSKKKL